MVLFLVITWSALALFWLVGAYLILKKRKASFSSEKEVGISILIAAKDEYPNLQRNLPHWLSLNYKNYEVLIVLNNTKDQSEEFLKSFVDSRLQVYCIPETPHGASPKKYALSYGIQKAKYPYIVFTDADCIPKSKNWLQAYNHSFQQGNEIVLGISPYLKQPGFLNGLIQWETFFTAFLYTTATLLKVPYMAVGRNWGLRKEIFFQEGGYSRHLHILSGDDDLFIQNLKNVYTFDILLEPASQTVSLPAQSWKQYFHQKKRHYSASQYYHFKSKMALLSLNFLQFAHFFSIFYVVSILQDKIFLVSLCLMELLKLITIQLVTSKLGMKIPLFYQILGGHLLIAFQMIVLPFSFFSFIKWK